MNPGEEAEHALRLGSHPPGRSRKQRVREFLSTSAAIVPPAAAALVDPALTMDEFQGGVIRLLWARARPILLELRRRGVPAAPSWRTMPTEATG